VKTPKPKTKPKTKRKPREWEVAVNNEGLITTDYCPCQACASRMVDYKIIKVREVIE
jgi:deoxycytidylate deaminase